MKFIERIKPQLERVRRLARQRPRVAITVAILVVVVFGWVLHSLSRTDSPAYTYYQVRRGDFLVSIIEGGTLKAVNEVTVRSEMEGVARIISIVPEGTNVHKGDLLVELDSADLRDRISAQEVTVQNAEFGWVQAKEGLAIQKSAIESSIKSSELTVEFAKSDLEKYKEGDWPQTRKQVEARITIAQEELERSRNRSDWTQKLFEKGYATKAELEADTLTVKRNQIVLDQAQEDLRLLTKYDYPKRVRQLEANVESYTKELERLRQRSEAQVAQYEANVRSARNTLDLHEKRLRDLKTQLEQTKMYAPKDGLAVYASSSAPGSGTLIEEGATIRQKQDIIKLPDVSKMMIEIRVHESHVQKIKPGLNAFVTIDSIPDQQFKGVVHKVAVLPDSTSRYFNPNLKVYVTEVYIEDELPDLKPGISGRAEIVVTNLHDVITVPIQAVTTVKGQQVCLVEDGARAKPVPVEVGLYNDKLIEVNSGLKVGQNVLLAVLNNSDNIDMGGSMADHDTNGARSSRQSGGGRNGQGKGKPAGVVPPRPVVPAPPPPARPTTNATVRSQ